MGCRRTSSRKGSPFTTGGLPIGPAQTGNLALCSSSPRITSGALQLFVHGMPIICRKGGQGLLTHRSCALMERSTRVVAKVDVPQRTAHPRETCGRTQSVTSQVTMTLSPTKQNGRSCPNRNDSEQNSVGSTGNGKRRTVLGNQSKHGKPPDGVPPLRTTE